MENHANIQVAKKQCLFVYLSIYKGVTLIQIRLKVFALISIIHST